MSLETVLARAGLPLPTDVIELGGGTFNTVLRAGDVVVKLAPGPEQQLLTYERDIMATEALYYELAADHGLTAVPRLLYHAPGEALVLSLCPGEPWPSVARRLDPAAVHGLRAAVGRELAALHRITGPGFGYPAQPLHATWRDAFTGMLDAVLRDAEVYGVSLPMPTDRIAAAVARVSACLDEVTVPSLVHFDLWDGNILVEGDPARLGGLIDAERAFWGDPLAELVSLRLFGELAPDPGLIVGYEAAGGRFVLDESARQRLALYRLYLYLIMWIEAVPRRFSPEHVAWRRSAVFEPAMEILRAL